MMSSQLPHKERLFMRVPWHKSLFFRVVVLCAVLLSCLFGSVIVITHHFFQEAAQQMEEEAADIAHGLEIRFEEGFDNDYDTLETELKDLYKGVDIKLDEQAEEEQTATFTIERLKDGGFARVARVPLMNAATPVLMTVTMTIFPQTEILRAFRNRYMMALIGVFVIIIV